MEEGKGLDNQLRTSYNSYSSASNYKLHHSIQHCVHKRETFAVLPIKCLLILSLMLMLGLIEKRFHQNTSTSKVLDGQQSETSVIST